MAVLVDASSPPTMTGSGEFATTASFTPPAGSTLLLLCGTTSASGGSVTVTDSLGTLTWSDAMSFQHPNYEAIRYAAMPTSAPITVTATFEGARTYGLRVLVLTGADGVGATDHFYDDYSLDPGMSLVTTVDDSLVVCASYLRFGGVTAVTPGSGVTEVADVHDGTINIWAGYKTTTTAGTYAISGTADAHDAWTRGIVEITPSTTVVIEDVPGSTPGPTPGPTPDGPEGMRIIDVRQSIADALNTIEGLNIRPRGPVKTPKQGDGWVTISRIAPSDYVRCTASFDVLIILSSDQAMAEELLDTWAIQAIDAVTGCPDLCVGEVALAPIQVLIDQVGVVMPAMSLTLTHEVEA